MNKRGNLAKNVSISILAQIVSLIVALILNLIVPKFIAEIEYANWQTYILYASYVGILHFGILDGLMLRYSQYEFDQLNKPLIRSQYQVVFSINIVISLILGGISVFKNNGTGNIIWILVAMAIITKNLFTYNSYLFQLTNRINKYATLVIAQKLCYGFLVIVLLVLRVNVFWAYCLADILGDIVACLFIVRYNKGLYLDKSNNLKTIVLETQQNLKCGVMLLIATWSSMFLVGGAKLVVQWRWDQLTFGKVSFSFSVSTLFLTFITAISIVLFPSLKRMEQDELPNLYKKLRSVLSPMLLLALGCYFPGAMILELWLPKYSESILYLGVLMPVIVFTSKVSLLTNNFLKAYRCEKKMLIINVVSVLFAFAGYYLLAYIINNLMMLFMWGVFIIMVRSIASEIAVMRIININVIGEIVQEVLLTIVFILIANTFSHLIGGIIYALVFVIYLFIHKKDLRLLISLCGS